MVDTKKDTDPEPFYTEVQEIILARYNKTFDWSLKAKLMGKKPTESGRIFVEETGVSDSLSAENFHVERTAMLEKLFLRSPVRLVKHLHANGVPICVATGNHKWDFELKTERHGELFSLMHHIVLGDDPEVKHRKPSPDAFLVAFRRFEVGGYGFRSHTGQLDSSTHTVADQVLKSLEDFNPSEWGLPPFIVTALAS